jgi:hypothetical protein
MDTIEIEDQYFCIVCSQHLTVSSEEAKCSFCGKKEKADYVCPAGHYVCEACRLAPAANLIKKTCEVSNETDPMGVALLLMKHPAIPVNGSINHLVTAFSLLTALRNSGKVNVGKPELKRIEQRMKNASQGICGSWGVCGCAIAGGVVWSIITGATYLSDKERSMGLRLASTILDAIAQVGGPRCCKMAAFLAIQVSVEYFEQELSISIPISTTPKPCIFNKLNSDCLKDRCPFYGEV